MKESTSALMAELSKRDGNYPPRILFVCLGNICRSPAADGILTQMAEKSGRDWIIDSAGTYGGHSGQLPDQRMRVHARRRGYELTHRARKFTAADFDEFDLIVAMDNRNAYDLNMLARTDDDSRKIVTMIEFVSNLATRYDHIPDPYYEGTEGFELVLDMLEDGCNTIYRLLNENRRS